jgi:hypothetical protein
MPSNLVLFTTVVALLTTSLTVAATDVDVAAVPATTAMVRPRSLYRACKADLARLCTPKRDEVNGDSERRMHVSPAVAYKCLEQHASELEADVCKAWIAGRQTCLTDVRPKLSQCTAAVRAVALREERAAARDSALLQKAVERASIEDAAAAGAAAKAAAPAGASAAAAADATAAARAEAGRKQIARVDKRVASLVSNATARVRPEVLMRCLRELPESAIGAACTATDFYSSFSMFKADRRGSRSREFRGRVGKREFIVPSTQAKAVKAADSAPAADATAAAKVAAAEQPAAADQAARASKKEKLANLIAAALDVAVDEKAGDSAKVVTQAAAAVEATPAVVADAAEKAAGETQAAAVLAAPVAPVAEVPVAVEKTA